MSEQSQKQNEALIKLLITANYQDGMLTIPENEDFKKRVESLEWDSGTSLELFLDTATSEVRDAITEDEMKVDFVKKQCAVFHDDDAKQFALDQIMGVLTSDGIEQHELAFLREVAKDLGLEE